MRITIVEIDSGEEFEEMEGKTEATEKDGTT